jgi:hypothetical protein
MKRRLVIEVESESYLEEQFLLDQFPNAVWLNMGGQTRFYMDIDEKESVLEALTKWKEIEKDGYGTH